MNERIKELKHQASLWCDKNIPEQYSEETNGYGRAWEDKFAELIVKECMEVVDSTPLGYGDYRDQIEKGMRDASVNGLKQHFGLVVI
jgi:hypothetical protein